MSDQTSRYCEKCGADWQGAPIPEASREAFGGKEFFSRRIGIYDRARDRTVAWQCPDCGHEVAR